MNRDMEEGKIVGISYKGKVAEYQDGKWVFKLDATDLGL